MATLDPAAIVGMLGDMGGAPPGGGLPMEAPPEEPPPDESPPGGISDALTTAIEAIHEAIRVEPDAEDKQVLSTCLQNMLKVQARNLQQSQGAGGAAAGAAGRSAVTARLGGGGY